MAITNSILGVAACFALIAAAFIPLALARDDDHDEERDEKGKEGREDDHDVKDSRRVDVDVDGDSVRIRLDREDDELRERVTLSFKTPDATFRLLFAAKDQDEKTKLSLMARLQGLAEYRDANANGQFDAGEELVSAWKMGSQIHDFEDGPQAAGRIDWEAPTVSDEMVDGVSGKRVDVSGSIGLNGTFVVRIHAFGVPATLENTTVRPTGAKIDFEIRQFPYVANDTALALFLATATSSKHKVNLDHGEIGDDEEGVAASGNVASLAVSLVFDWKTTATVDGVVKDVATTTLRTKEVTEQDEDKAVHMRKDVFALSYARGDVIVHDPELVAVFGKSTSGFLPGLGVAMSIGAVAIGTVFVMGSRRRT